MVLSDKMWFGTQEKMQYVPVPLATSEFTNVGWEESATLLNGGGWSRHSMTTHKEFTLNWGMNKRDRSQIIKDYRDGIYGDGPFYFVDPMAEWINLFPSWWAAPVMGCYDAPSLVPGQVPIQVRTPANDNGYPLYSALYEVEGTPDTDPGNSLFIPIPPDTVLSLGVHGEASGTAVVQVRGIRFNGSIGPRINLPMLHPNSAAATNAAILGTEFAGVRVYITRRSTAPSSILLSGLIAKVSTAFDPTQYPYVLDDIVYMSGPVEDDGILVDGPVESDIMLLDVPNYASGESGRFVGGRGHSGLSFVGAVLEAPVGGRPDMSTTSAKFIETGGWD